MKTFVAFCLSVFLVLPVFAQDVGTILKDDHIRWSLVTAQIESSLESEYPTVREQTLKNAIVAVTLYRDKINLSNQEMLLRRVYEESKFPDHRELSLALLQAIGGTTAQDLLTHHTTEVEKDHVRAVLASVLRDYFESHQVSAEIG